MCVYNTKERLRAMFFNKCPNCMQDLAGTEYSCPFCNFNISGYEEKTFALKLFTILNNRYLIGRVLGVGGFGITYIGWDIHYNTYVAIKEYFPEGVVSRDTMLNPNETIVVSHDRRRTDFEKGLKRYLEEAENLSKFSHLPGIVNIKEFFYANDTGYIVMDYIDGIDLKNFMKQNGYFNEHQVLFLMKPVLDSLSIIHNAGLVHRDISPDNIMIDSHGKITLIDFGSVRNQSVQTEKTYTVTLKHGYAPPEQYYSKGFQGPWTDIYSICATMYKMLTGKVPTNGLERIEGAPYISISEYGVPISRSTELIIQKGLSVRHQDRYQNIKDLINALYFTGYTSAPIIPQAPTENKKSRTPLIVGLSVILVILIGVIIVTLLFF